MNTINNLNNQQILFKGIFGARRLTYDKRYAAIMSAHTLSMPEQDVIDIAQKTSNNKWNLFELLADKFNSINYYRTKAEKENPKVVKEIFDSIKKSHAEHFSFISQYNGPLNNLKRIFNSAHNDKKRLRFAIKLHQDINVKYPNSNPNLISELLESPNSKEYIKNYDKYKPYIELNCEDKDAVKNLDNLVANKQFDENIDNINIELRKKMFPFEDTEYFNRNLYAHKLNENRASLIKTFQEINLVDNDMLKHGGDQTLSEIFSSTNSKNLESRSKLAWHSNESITMSAQEKINQLKTLNSLFNKMDNDKHIANFVNHILQNIYTNNLSIKELETITNQVSGLKLDIFKKNAMQIICNSKEGSRAEVFKHELENPFYESYSGRINRKTAEEYGFRKKRSFLSKTMTRIQNQFRIWEFKLKSIHNNSVIAQNEINPIEVKPVEITPAKITPDVINPEKINTNAVEKDVVATTENITPEIKENIKSVDDKKAKRAASKAQIKQNISDIIAGKLGLKTLEKQREAFGSNATKIRLNLLPEIFASITDTRKADRAVGKYKINSSNKDALDLYLLINGSNKKYINYMLKKRNADNTRMFEVKDIIASVRKAEAKIAADKKTNPDYRANDARKYYNHLYEAKLQQYGKVKKTAKQVNTKA